MNCQQLLALLLVVLEPCVTMDVMWRKVKVDLDLSEARKEVFTICSPDSNLCCPMLCATKDWCEMWYHDDEGHCVLTNILVSPDYQSVSPEPSECYTKRKKDLIVQHLKEVYGTGTHGNFPLRLVTNLINGLFDRRNDKCYVSQDIPKPWVVMDLGEEMTVREVYLVAPNSDYMAEHYFRDVEIRLGLNLITNGDLSSYQRLGKYEGPIETKEQVVIKANVPIVGRYISFQKITEHDRNVLALCYIEVY